uniref:NADH-ubiquinone oxidoreductase chain 4L n=1 Tax=Nemertopsis tetraclitophila TaxID=1417004 RepID=A0A075CEY2_9BILA|nr:NADH dehydrogenase subunit 4L [Nemertopsis tetraclitophila]AGZ63902.1 NADH dehydrogenase subunit 4L [Nemertopsis tetraclitophila]
MNFSYFFSVFYMGVFSILVGMFIFVVQRYHFMMSLLCLEFMVLGLFLMTISIFFFNKESYMVFLLLSFAACEASLGLGLLVSMVRSHGSDFFNIMTVYEC